MSINVTAWDPVAVTPFNPPVFAYSSQGEQPLIASESMYTYLVDEDGCINFPIIGKQKTINVSICPTTKLNP